MSWIGETAASRHGHGSCMQTHLSSCIGSPHRAKRAKTAAPPPSGPSRGDLLWLCRMNDTMEQLGAAHYDKACQQKRQLHRPHHLPHLPLHMIRDMHGNGWQLTMTRPASSSASITGQIPCITSHTRAAPLLLRASWACPGRGCNGSGSADRSAGAMPPAQMMI